MNRITRTRLICAALAVVVLSVALIGLPGGVDSSVGQAAPTRSPRPHPISHLSFPPGINLLHPRPHPVSHLRLAQ